MIDPLEGVELGAPKGATTPSEEELRRKLFWLAAIRILVITLLLAGGSFFLLQTGQRAADRAVTALSGLVAAVSLLQIAIALSLWRGWRLSLLAAAQVVGDVAFAIALLYVTGVSDSLFSFVLPLVAVSGGTLLGARGSWFAALGAFASYAVLLVCVKEGIVAPLGLAAPALTGRGLLQALFVHGSALFLTAGLVTYVLNQARREGERADAAESSLLHLHVLHDSIVRSIGSGILTTDNRGKITFVNRAGEEILGREQADLRGRPLAEVFPAILAEGAPERFRQEAEWTTPAGEARLLGFAHTPLLAPSGEAMGIAAVFQDLTGLRDLEARAARSERLAMVGELAAGLAHELRNPLASISGAIELMDREGGEERPLFRIVMREAERLNRLVTEFLDYAAPGAPKLGAVDLRALVESTLEVFRHDPAAQEVVAEAHLEEARAWADEDQLRQVLWNLLLNAAQASPPGLPVVVSCAEEGGRAVLLVEDQGCGISPDALKKIFDPFFTTKEKGSGLGLPVVHRVVEELGGELEVESKEGEGTRFTVSLPAAAAQGEGAQVAGGSA